MQDLEKFRQVGDEAYGVLLGSGDAYYQGVLDAMRYVVAGHVGGRKFAHLLGAVEAKQRSEALLEALFEGMRERLDEAVARVQRAADRGESQTE